MDNTDKIVIENEVRACIYEIYEVLEKWGCSLQPQNEGAVVTKDSVTIGLI